MFRASETLDRVRSSVYRTQYPIPFRCIVPQRVDKLLVVGRAASFDSLPHGSARTIPVGMATGEAAGAAVALSIEEDKTFRQIIKNSSLINQLQELLNDQGMVIEPLPGGHRTISNIGL